MSEGIDKHIGNLTMGTDVTPDPVLEDRGDTLIEEVGERPAIPPEVEDEQAEVFEKASSEGKVQEEDEADTDWQKRYEEAERARNGLLGEVGNLRGKLSEQGSSIEQLRQIFLAREEAEWEAQQEAEAAARLEQERQIYGDDVVDDPAVAYMRDKWEQTQDIIERQAQEQEGRRQMLREQSQQWQAQQAAFKQEQAMVAAQEKQYADEKPDYYDAYKFAKQARVDMYTDMGYDKDTAIAITRQEEAGLRQQQMAAGGNVADAIYKMAHRLGYKQAEKNVEQARQEPSYKDNTPNFDKMRAGVNQQRAGGMQGTGGTASGGSRKLSAEEFYNTVPLPTRLEIQADPDKFEELGRTGYITMD